MADSFIEPYFAISESRLKEILRLLRLNHNYINYADVSEQVIRANPIPSPLLNPSMENNNPVPNSKELILLAETDWHNREERKHQYEMIPWTNGWMTGFLSERKPYWPKVHEVAIRRDEREKVLDIINEENNARLKGLEILFATPTDKRAELAQDVYLKEAYFELTLVKHLIESLRTTTSTKEHDNK